MRFKVWGQASVAGLILSPPLEVNEAIHYIANEGNNFEKWVKILTVIPTQGIV
jgi:hypothetical protein